MSATTKKPQVPESLLKKRKENKVHKERVKAKVLTQRKSRQQKKKLIFKRAQAYVKEYRTMEKQARGLIKVAEKYDNFYVPPEPKVVYVMRIRGINNIHPRPRKIMQLLRLRQINNGIFLRLNKATANMLKLAEPYITWGTPNLKTVRDLIYKRGYAKIKGSRIPLTDNALIENVLGKYNILCVEDLIHEICTCGPRFREVSNFLWPFKLSNPNGGWRKKLNHYNDGGDYGNRDEDINKLLRKMI